MANKDADPKITQRQANTVRAYIAKRASEMAMALIEHGLGTRDMTPSQVKALQVALDRVLPSMQSIDQTNHTDQPEWTPEEVEAALADHLATLARRSPDKLRAMLERPALEVVNGGKS